MGKKRVLQVCVATITIEFQCGGISTTIGRHFVSRLES